MKSFKYWIFFLWAISAVCLKAQTGNILYVNGNDETATNYDLDEIRKLTFTSSELVINKNNGSQTLVGFTDLQHLTFAPFYPIGPDLGTKVSNETVLNIYPSPVENRLHVKNYEILPNDVAVTIIDLSGRLITDCKMLYGSINISHLKSGIYFIKIENTTFKFIKK
ncbi:MAG: T9SS type A sorting domain-containing protein [Paludibacteraceae bacterium]